MTVAGGVSTRRWREVAFNLASILLLLFAASFLPPDGSLAEVRARGVLRVCAPAAGLSAENTALLARMAAAVPARMRVDRLPSIGRDANPRNWRVNRAQCDVIAGGLADTATTQTFLATVPTGQLTGWALVARGTAVPLRGSRVAVVGGASGLSRLALSGWLRAQDLQPLLVDSEDRAAASITTGAAVAAVAPATVAARVAAATGLDWTVLALDGAPPVAEAFGFWKGDATLIRLARRTLMHPG